MRKISIIFIISFFMFFTMLSKPTVAWWNFSWNYRRPITITEQSGNTLTDYQVKIILNSSNIDWTKVNDDLSDIRFTYYNSTDDTEIEIPYWIENYVVNTNATIWVKVPKIPASSTATIYVYYGNMTTVTSESNGFNTFDLYDDFEDGILDTDLWKWVEKCYGCDISYEEVNGYLRVWVSNTNNYGVGGVWSNQTFQNSVRLKFEAYPKYSYCGGSTAGFGSEPSAYNDWTPKPYEIIDSQSDAGNFVLAVHDGTDGASHTSNLKFGTSAWNYTILRNSTSNRFLEIKNATHEDQFIVAENFTNNALPIAFYVKDWCSQTNANFEIKVFWVFVSKYTDPEPTYNIGIEENQPPSVDTPKTYDENYVEKTSFIGGDKVVIRVNITDAQGAEDIDKVLIEIIDNSSTVQVANETMTNVSSITDGYTYEYNYTLPISSTSGLWTINVYANDTQNSWNSNSTTFEVTVYLNIYLPYGDTYGRNETVFINGTVTKYPSTIYLYYYNSSLSIENATLWDSYYTENGYYEFEWYNESSGDFTLYVNVTGNGQEFSNSTNVTIINPVNITDNSPTEWFYDPYGFY